MKPNIIQRMLYWWWAKFVIDASEYDELKFERIKHWKVVWCWIIWHDPCDVEVGEHWASSEHIEMDYAMICSRCGSWL